MNRYYEAIARLIGLYALIFSVGLYWGVSGMEKPVKNVEAQMLVTNDSKTKVEVEEVIEQLDIMVEEVEAEKKEEPMLNIEDRIVFACKKYDIPWEIPLAIARLETGWFKSNAYINGNNPGGMSRNEKPIKYDTIEEGVEAFISNLANNYFAIGLDTPEEIGKKYCPVNPEWASLIRKMMKYEYMGG